MKMINTSSYRIIPETHFSTEKAFITYPNFTNKGIYSDSYREVFPYNIPFHPGYGPEIDYPVEPEYPEEDPGDDPDD